MGNGRADANLDAHTHRLAKQRCTSIPMKKMPGCHEVKWTNQTIREGQDAWKNSNIDVERHQNDHNILEVRTDHNAHSYLACAGHAKTQQEPPVISLQILAKPKVKLSERFPDAQATCRTDTSITSMYLIADKRTSHWAQATVQGLVSCTT